MLCMLQERLTPTLKGDLPGQQVRPRARHLQMYGTAVVPHLLGIPNKSAAVCRRQQPAWPDLSGFMIDAGRAARLMLAVGD